MTSVSTLTWVLMILAVTVIGGVLIYNYFQEKKQAPKSPIHTQPKSAPVATMAKEAKEAKQAKQEQAFIPPVPSFDVSSQEQAFSDPTKNHFVGNRIEQSSYTEPSLGVLTPYLGVNADEAKASVINTTEWVTTAHSADTDHVLSPDVIETSQSTHELSAPEREQKQALSTLPGSVLSEDYDCLIEFVLPAVQSGERLLSLTAAHRRAGGKPVAFDGLLATGQWASLQPGELYIVLRSGLLLANRHGPLNAMEFSDFGSFAQELAKQLGCEITLADMPSTLSRAREIDRRCAELDAQLGISIQTSTVTSAALLSSVAVEHGLTERGGGRYAKLDNNGGTLFTLSFGEQGDKLAMLLDVPRANAKHRPWQQMVQCAESLAQRLDGQLVDDTGKPLPAGIWNQIEEQLRQRYWALDAAKIEPGSARALRLFN